MTSPRTEAYYDSAVSNHEHKLVRTLNRVIYVAAALGCGFLMTFLFSFIGFTVKTNTALVTIILISSFCALLVAVAVIILALKKQQPIEKRAEARIAEILNTHLSQPITIDPSTMSLWGLCNELHKAPTRDSHYTWYNVEKMELYRLSYHVELRSYSLKTANLTDRDLVLILNGSTNHAYTIFEETEETPKEATPANTSKTSPNKVAVSTTEWYKAIRKNMTEELIPTVTDLRQFIDTANLVETTKEEKHTIQRILTDSLAAAELYQSAIISSKVLPNAEGIKAEADAALHSTIHALNTEAEQLVTMQAATAMNKLRLHADYVTSSN